MRGRLCTLGLGLSLVYACSDASSLVDASAPVDVGQSPDTGTSQDSGIPPDSGIIDATVRDTGPADSGPRPDAGPPQACPLGEEGCECAFGGSCNELGLSCLDTSAGLSPPEDRFYFCFRACATDVDCDVSTAGNSLCRPIFGLGRGCVSTEIPEGLTATITRTRGTEMQGCEDDLVALPGFVGSGINIREEHVGCARACDPSASGTCAPAYPYCNPFVTGLEPTTGICGARRAGTGDICSRSSAIGFCDTSQSTAVDCIGAPFEIDDPADPSPYPDPGVCMQLCDLNSPDCSASDDPGAGPAACAQVNANNFDIGFCSVPCTQFPNTCTGTAAFGAGSTCSGDLQFELGYPFNLCIGTVTPTIAEWNFLTPPPNDCLAEENGALRCEAGTLCAQGPSYGVCVRLCSTSTPTGCTLDPTGNDTCTDNVVTDPADGLGVCRPF